jgi:hypothetical protein
MFLVSKKELNAIPLDKLYHAVQDAANTVEESLEKESRASHKRRVERLIESEYSTREDSYEGNIEEDYPYVNPNPEFIKKERETAKKEALKLWAEKYDLKGNASWFMPQLTAHIAKIDTCGYNCSEYIQQFGIDDYHKGIWTLATHSVRGYFITKQYSPESRNYSALVPLLLMPHKKFDNIPYSSWSKEGLHLILDSNLYAAMTLEFDLENTPEELLAIRQKALTYQSGKQAGEVRNPATSHKVYFLSGDLKKLPWLAQVMVFQIWCAHPSNRTELMVLDWKDWDKMPDPLISKDVFAKPKPEATTKLTSDTPWG